jgi:hypothetical protein
LAFASLQKTEALEAKTGDQQATIYVRVVR